MVRVPHALAATALVVAATAAASAQSLKPEWSRPVGGKTRFVGVEEYGRCSVFVDNGVIQVLDPHGEVMWRWPFAKVSKYIHPEKVAVSNQCDAIAFVGDASYRYAWIVARGGRAVNVPLVATPADVAFDRAGKFVAIGTYAGSLFLYSRNGEQQWMRKTDAAIVQDLEFTDDDQRIVFKGWGGAGVVSAAGQIEWSQYATRLAASRDLKTFIVSFEPNHGPGPSTVTVTDEKRDELWTREAPIEAFLSADGQRVLASVEGIGLFTRTGARLASFSDYLGPIALSEDGTRAWLRAHDHIACVDDSGSVLQKIDGETSYRGGRVSRDFGEVLVIRDKDLTPVSVERYAISAPCKP